MQRQCLARKISSKFCDCTQIMTNILIIFFTQYFQRKKMILWLESPFSTKGFKVSSFSKFWNGWGKKTSKQFLQAKCWKGKKDFPHRGNKMIVWTISLNHLPWREKEQLVVKKGIELHWGEIFSNKKRQNCPNDQFPSRSKISNVWQENIKNKLCSNQMFFI